MKYKLEDYHSIEYVTDSNSTNVLIAHGYAEHIDRYKILAEALHEKRCNVYGYDFRGHGQSKGSRATINTFEDLVDDFRLFYQNVPKENLRIYGHSMGSLVIAKWLILDQPTDIKKVVLSSGLFKLDDSVAPLLRKMAKFFSKVVPWLPAVKIDVSSISSLPSEVEKYKTDPLIYHGGTKARFGHEMMKAMEYVQKHSPKINQEIMIIQGDADRLTNMSGSEELYENISSQKKSLHIIEGGYHELLNDSGRFEYIELVSDYLSR